MTLKPNGEHISVSTEALGRAKQIEDVLVYQNNLHRAPTKPYEVICMTVCRSVEIPHAGKKFSFSINMRSYTEEMCRIACDMSTCHGWSFDGGVCTICNGSVSDMEDSEGRITVEMDRSKKTVELCVGALSEGGDKITRQPEGSGVGVLLNIWPIILAALVVAVICAYIFVKRYSRYRRIQQENRGQMRLDEASPTPINPSA